MNKYFDENFPFMTKEQACDMMGKDRWERSRNNTEFVSEKDMRILKDIMLDAMTEQIKWEKDQKPEEFKNGQFVGKYKIPDIFVLKENGKIEASEKK